MTVQEEFAKIRGNRCIVAAEEIEGWAKAHPDSAWHGRLEWDDKVAGKKYRIQQVRMILAIEFKDPEVGRTLVSLSIDRPSGGGYRDTVAVLQNSDLVGILLQDALNELERFQKKYQHLQQLTELWPPIGKVTKKWRRKREREGRPSVRKARNAA